MNAFLLLTVLNFVALFLKAQSENDLVLLTVKDDRLELAKALKFLQGNNPKFICVNIDLTKCNEDKSDKVLTKSLWKVDSLMMITKIRRFGIAGEELLDFIGCPYLYPERVTKGFVNLIGKEEDENLVEKVQITNTNGKRVRYHFAVNIALRLNAGATRSFIKSSPNIVPINFERARKFRTYKMEQFYGNKENSIVLDGKVLILSIDRPEEYRQVSKKRKMTTSEIFANIACQLIAPPLGSIQR